MISFCIFMDKIPSSPHALQRIIFMVTAAVDIHYSGIIDSNQIENDTVPNNEHKKQMNKTNKIL